MLKSSLLNEEARRKDNTSNSDYKALFTDSCDSNRGRDRQRSPKNRDKPNRGRSLEEGSRVSTVGRRHYKKDKRGGEGIEPKRISDNKNTSFIGASVEELMFVKEQSCVNLASDESRWVVD